MRMTDVLEKPLIVPHMRAKRKHEAMVELASHIAHCRPEMDAAEIARVLLARESQGTTALGNGLAIPHAKLAGIGGLVACLGRSQKGIAFDAPDGQPARFLFVVLAPADSPGAHLKLLARVSQVFRDADFRHRLVRARTGGDMYRLLAHEDLG